MLLTLIFIRRAVLGPWSRDVSCNLLDVFQNELPAVSAPQPCR